MMSLLNPRHLTKKLTFFTYTFIYFVILIFFRYLIIEIFNTGHADSFYYYEESKRIATEKNFIDILFNIFNYSSNINSPLIHLFSLTLKLQDRIYTILICNSLMFVFLFFQLNNLLHKLNYKQINFYEFLILSIFLSYFNVGINKEIIFTLLLINLFYFFVCLRNKKSNFFYLFLKILSTFLLISFIKPFHALIIILPFSVLLVSILIFKKKLFIYLLPILFLIFILLINIFPIIINFHYVKAFDLFFNISNIIEFINYNRAYHIEIGLKNFNLQYLNNTSSILSSNIFSYQNFYIAITSLIESLLYPNVFEIAFAFKEKARFTLFVLFESLIIKFTILYLFISIFKKQDWKFNLFAILFLIYITIAISINIPNNGICYRYLYPYKFLLIFLGYLKIKEFGLKRYW